MSFTRFHDDPNRVKKQIQESTGPGRYMLDVPGNGLKPCFMEDPFVRLQKWGANLQTNTINLESALMGIDRKDGRDCIDQIKKMPKSSTIEYPSCEPFTEQPRATMPAWTARDLEQNNFSYLPLDPQEHTCIPFQNNLNTRLIERDNFKIQAPCTDNTKLPSINSQTFGGIATPQNSCNRIGTCGSANL
uniref:Uncharacterized protein n=1 Tax=viral metagenome TaxID=1070528 RepID=A0A6C0LI49_9ZZZZ